MNLSNTWIRNTTLASVLRLIYASDEDWYYQASQTNKWRIALNNAAKVGKIDSVELNGSIYLNICQALDVLEYEYGLTDVKLRFYSFSKEYSSIIEKWCLTDAEMTKEKGAFFNRIQNSKALARWLFDNVQNGSDDDYQTLLSVIDKPDNEFSVHDKKIIEHFIKDLVFPINTRNRK